VWKATSPGQRGRITVDRSLLWRGPPFKPLTEGLVATGGRTASGRISVWHHGGGHKRLYRRVDFVRSEGQESRIVRIEYDPNRSARIALLRHEGPAWEGARLA
jgi:large subunit ribosomal protein L2